MLRLLAGFPLFFILFHANADFETVKKPTRSFILTGLPKVEPSDPHILRLETRGAVYKLNRDAVLKENMKYLSGFKAKSQVSLKIDGKMILDMELRPAAKVTL